MSRLTEYFSAVWPLEPDLACPSKEHHVPEKLRAHGEPPSPRWQDDLRAIFGGSVEVNVHLDLSEEVAGMLDKIQQTDELVNRRLNEVEARFNAIKEQTVRDVARAVTLAIEPIFNSLVQEWKTTRGSHSRVDKLVLNKAYQRIIGLGQPAVPLLIREMQQRPSHWDWALKAITGADPVPVEAWGDIRQIAAAWAKWGAENGLVW